MPILSLAAPQSLAEQLRALRTESAEPDHAQPLGDDLGEAPRIFAKDGSYEVHVDGEVTTGLTRAEAFGLVEESAWFADATGRKNLEADAYRSLAEGRWLDSTSIEDLPSAIDGSQIKAEMIGEMARNLARAKTAIPIDGGNVSEVHESVWNSAARAAGWVFAGVEVVDAQGREHLWLYARLLPEVDDQLERQELLFGSIAFIGEDTDRYGDGDPIGARLISYALTNTPFVDGLEPHAPRARSAMTTGPYLAITRSRRLMSKKKGAPAGASAVERIRSLAKILELDPKKQTWQDAFVAARAASRGPAKDKLNELATMLGVSMEDATDVYGGIYDAIRALQDAAAVESVLEGAPLPGEGAGEGAGEGERGQVTGRTMLEGFESEEAQDAFTAAALEGFRQLFGAPEATPAELLDLWAASIDALMAALEGGDEPDENAGPGDQPTEGERAAKAEALGLRTQVKSMRTELDKLKADAHLRTVNDAIDSRFGEAKLNPPQGEDREELISLCRSAGKDWERVINLALRNANVPPTGTVSAPNGHHKKTGSAMSKAEARTRCANAIRSENPKLKRAQVWKQADARAREEFPEVFSGSAQ